MRRHHPEQEIQRAVFEHLAVRVARNCFAFHVPNGGARSPVEAAIMKGIGVKAGIPDIVVVHDGQFFGLELKAPNGRLTAAQRDAHAALAAAGATVSVAYSLDDALAQLESWKLLHGSRQGCWP
jgi:VRR-NUC domain